MEFTKQVIIVRIRKHLGMSVDTFTIYTKRIGWMFVSESYGDAKSGNIQLSICKRPSLDFKFESKIESGPY